VKSKKPKTVDIKYCYQNDIWMTENAPEVYTKVVLVQKKYLDGLDLMWAQVCEHVTVGFLVLGYFTKPKLRNHDNAQKKSFKVYNPDGTVDCVVEGTWINIFKQMEEGQHIRPNVKQVNWFSGACHVLREDGYRVKRVTEKDGTVKAFKIAIQK